MVEPKAQKSLAAEFRAIKLELEEHRALLLAILRETTTVCICPMRSCARHKWPAWRKKLAERGISEKSVWRRK